MNITTIISMVWVIIGLLKQYGPAIKVLCESMEGLDMPGPEKKAKVLEEVKKLPEATAFPDWMLDTAIQIVFVCEFRIGKWLADKKRQKEAAAAAKRARIKLAQMDRQLDKLNPKK